MRQLLAKLLDVHVDGSGVARKVIAPDQVEELAALKDATWMSREQCQQVELLRTELNPSLAVAARISLGWSGSTRALRSRALARATSSCGWNGLVR